MDERGSSFGNNPSSCGLDETGGLPGSSVRTVATSARGCNIVGVWSLGWDAAATGTTGAGSLGLEFNSEPTTSLTPLATDVLKFSANCAVFTFGNAFTLEFDLVAAGLGGDKRGGSGMGYVIASCRCCCS